MSRVTRGNYDLIITIRDFRIKNITNAEEFDRLSKIAVINEDVFYPSSEPSFLFLSEIDIESSVVSLGIFLSSTSSEKVEEVPSSCLKTKEKIIDFWEEVPDPSSEPSFLFLSDLTGKGIEYEIRYNNLFYSGLENTLYLGIRYPETEYSSISWFDRIL